MSKLDELKALKRKKTEILANLIAVDELITETITEILNDENRLCDKDVTAD